jgi:DNA-binding CsgD family transcriptional regulator
MRIEHLSKQDTILLLEIIHESLSCSSEEQIVQLMSRLGDLLPYQAAISCISRLGAQGVIKAIKVVNVDYPADYVAELMQQDLVAQDPIVIENYKNFRLQYWADTFKRQPWSEAMDTIIGLAEDFGFHKVRKGCGYGHGVCNSKHTEGSFFCYHGLERRRRTEEILRLTIPHFHETLLRLDNLFKGHTPLSPKETEVLKWIAQGKSTWDVSMILGISERTVKFHVANFLQKLDAVTRPQAVAIALEQGLVEIE